MLHTEKVSQILNVVSWYGHIRLQYHGRWIFCIPCGYEIFKMASGDHTGFWHLHLYIWVKTPKIVTVEQRRRFLLLKWHLQMLNEEFSLHVSQNFVGQLQGSALISNAPRNLKIQFVTLLFVEMAPKFSSRCGWGWGFHF